MRRTNRGGCRRLMLAAASAVLVLANAAVAQKEDPRRTGMRPPNDREQAWEKNHLVRAEKVSLNRTALQRVNEQRRAKGQRLLSEQDVPLVLPGAEISGTVGVMAVGATANGSVTGLPLPGAVDNSTSQFFPPVRSQGALGSCAQFSSVYYTLTYMTAMTHHWDAQNGGDAYRFCPLFTYNMVNGGADSGSWWAWDILINNGCALWSEFPYVENPTVWCLNPEAWRHAISYRADSAWMIDGLAAADNSAAVEKVKTLLADGYIMNYATYISSWQWKTVDNDPSTTADDAYVGKSIAYCQNGSSGGHGMTVVGYNDDLWCDVNANGVVDAGEKGAFRICNSWGTGWGEAGFAWILYDALRSTSIIPNAPARTDGIFWYGQVQGIKARFGYTPRVLAKVTMNHAARNTIAVKCGYLSLTGEKDAPNSCLQYQGGAYAFDGSTTPVDGTFYFDVSDVTPAVTLPTCYVRLTDSTSGNLLLAKAASIINVQTGVETPCTQTPVTFDAATQRLDVVVPEVPNSLPVAIAQGVDTPPNTAKAITLTGSDFDGDALTYALVSQPSRGTLSGTPPNLTYSPPPDYLGTDSFTFKVNDGEADSLVANVVVSVAQAPNNPGFESPVLGTGNYLYHPTNALWTFSSNAGLAANGSPWYAPSAPQGVQAAFLQMSGHSISQSVNFASTGNFKLGFYAVGRSGYGSMPLNVLVDGVNVLTLTTAQITTVAWTRFETASFAVTAGAHTIAFVNGALDGDHATVIDGIQFVPIVAGNHAPVANPQSVLAQEDTPRPIALTGSDVDGDALSFALVTSPAHGSLSGSLPNITYLPYPEYSGADSLAFKVNDGTVDSATVTIPIAVAGVNDVPVAQSQSVSTVEGAPVAVTLGASDPEGAALSYVIVSAPTHGVLSGTAPNLTYTPAAGFSGSDAFTFKVSDGALYSALATVSLTVQAYRMPENPVNVVQGLDSKYYEGAWTLLPNFDSLTPVAVSTVSNFIITDRNVNDYFGFKFTGYIQVPTDGAYTFYTSSDDGSALYIGSQRVVDNDGMHPMVEQSGTIALKAGKHAISVVFFEYSGGEGLTVSWQGPGIAKQVVPSTALFRTIANVAPVITAVTADATAITWPVNTTTVHCLASDADNNPLTYAWSKQSGPGTATFATATAKDSVVTFSAEGTYVLAVAVSDGIASVTGTVSVVVYPALNQAPVALPQSVTTAEDTAKAITLTGTDADGDTLSYVIVSQPAHGALSGTAPNMTYTPAANYSGADAFTFKVNDGTVDSAAATVSITVTAVNDAPVALPQSVTTAQDTAKAMTLAGTDADGDTLSYAIVSQPAHGTLSGTAPNVTYTPAAGYYGSDAFTYKVNDGKVDSTAATVTITVTQNSLPSPWQHQDVGTPGIAGNADYTNGTFTIRGAGLGITSRADSFQFVYQASSGDCSITARVAGLDSASSGARAGVIIRETLNNNAVTVGGWVTAGSGLQFTSRTSTGGKASVKSVSGFAPPCWVRLTRVGSTLTGYSSTNGTTWTKQFSSRITMGTTAYVGLGTCSGVTNIVSVGTMDNVTAVP